MELFGVMGMILVQFSTVAQIIRLYKSKKTGGLSVGFLLMIFFGLICYLVYSISISDKIYIISNCVGLFFISISICQYYYYFWHENGLPDIEDVQCELCGCPDDIPLSGETKSCKGEKWLRNLEY